MNHLPFTLLAYFFNSISVTVNKILLKKAIPDPFVYVFYVSIFSLILIPAVPFTRVPSSGVLTLASSSTLLWTIGAYFMFKALKVGLVSRVIPVIGTLIPLILLIFASGTSVISLNQIWAVGFLILGLIFITILEWKGKMGKSEALFEVLSAIFFAVSYILLRQAYLEGNFFSILIWSRVVLIPLVILILITPHLRKKVLSANGQKINIFGKSGVLFLIGQILGGASELLLLFSISLANPVLVNSLQGTQYIFLLIFGIFLKERYTQLSLLTKLLGIIFIALGLYILAFPQTTDGPELGITFSPKYAHSLGLDPQTTYVRMLEELRIKRVRLPVYWDEIETFPRQLNFSRVDFYLEQALTRGVDVILILGLKQPRWPECFAPVWVNNLMVSAKEQRILELIRAEVLHFKKFPNISAWQVENEPYFAYGECQPKTSRILPKELAIVGSLDTRPVLVTDAGEPGLWIRAIKDADIFGTTLYREAWGPLFGHHSYPLPPAFYRLKKQLAEALARKAGVEFIISELQAEPWIPSQIATRDYPVEDQAKLMPVATINSNVEYAKQTGFEKIYLWGVEWWYFMEKNGYPQYLDEAKTIFKSN